MTSPAQLIGELAAGCGPAGPLMLAAAAVLTYPAPPLRFADGATDLEVSTPSALRRAVVVGLAALAAVLLVFPTAVLSAAVLGAAAAVASGVSQLHAHRQAATVDASLLVLGCELWAAGVAAGATVSTALGLALGAIGDRARTDPAIRALTVVHGLLQLGTDPGSAWASARAVPELTPIAAAAARTNLTGAELAASLREHAELVRREEAAAELRRAERAGVLMTAPLALCFLPGFICLGLAPVIIALFGSLDIGR